VRIRRGSQKAPSSMLPSVTPVQTRFMVQLLQSQQSQCKGDVRRHVGKEACSLAHVTRYWACTTHRGWSQRSSVTLPHSSTPLFANLMYSVLYTYVSRKMSLIEVEGNFKCLGQRAVLSESRIGHRKERGPKSMSDPNPLRRLPALRP